MYIGIKISLREPFKEHPNEGIININIDSMKRREKEIMKKKDK